MAEHDHAHSSLKPISAEMRAQMIVDSIGSVAEGDYRKRVFETAVAQIRNAQAIAAGVSVDVVQAGEFDR